MENIHRARQKLPQIFPSTLVHKEQIPKISKKILQGVLDYRDLNNRNPRNTGIYKKFQVIQLSGLFTNNSR